MMKAENWAITAVTIGILTLAGLRGDGQEDKTSPKRAENFPRDASGAAPAGPIEVQPTVLKVLASDIGTRVQIIGRLGYPLGELVTIRGAWIRPCGLPNQPVKDDTPYFSVTSVNGKIDNVCGATDHRSRLEWVVTLKIDNMIQGRLPMETFQLAIHSPSQEGVESGRQ
jgi:hypothetical protein